MARSQSLSIIGMDLCRKAFNRLGYTQEELGKEVNIVKSTVNRFINGKPVDRDVYIRLCNRLGIDSEQASSERMLKEPILLENWLQHGVRQADWNLDNSDHVFNSIYNIRRNSADIEGCRKISFDDNQKFNLLVSVLSLVDQNADNSGIEVNIRLFPESKNICLPVGLELCVLVKDSDCEDFREVVTPDEEVNFIFAELGLFKGDEIALIIYWQEYQYTRHFVY